ncbi:MAG: leucyl aminopeptidase, partial [Alphaproteobacteria bacterium]|nr:leucyl aminopeptidase [Alphaproteobacteria bacterium]
MKIKFVPPRLPRTGTLVLFVGEGRKLSPQATQLDRRSGKALTRALGASRFKGKAEETLAILAPAKLGVARVLLVGTGKADPADRALWQHCGGVILSALNGAGESEAAVLVEAGDRAAEIAAHVAYGARLRSYRFDKYRTKEKSEQKPSLKTLSILVDDVAAARRRFAPLDKIADGVFFTRDLVSEPANVIYPESLAERAKELKELGVEVEILDEKKMAALGMGALIGVGQGSARPPRLLVMQWHGADDKKQAPVAFVGKGITFDTGGISIKPADSMEEMITDMAGSAAVVGAMYALAARKAKVNA